MNSRPPDGGRLADLGWLIVNAAHALPRELTLALAACVAAAPLVPVQLWLTKSLVDSIAARVAGQDSTLVPTWLALLACVLVLQRVLQGGQTWLQAELRETLG